MYEIREEKARMYDFRPSSSSSKSKHNCASARSSLTHQTHRPFCLRGTLDVRACDIRMYVSRCIHVYTWNHVQEKARIHGGARARQNKSKRTVRGFSNLCKTKQRFPSICIFTLRFPYMLLRMHAPIYVHLYVHTFLISREAYRRLIYRSPTSYFQADRGRNSSQV